MHLEPLSSFGMDGKTTMAAPVGIRSRGRGRPRSGVALRMLSIIFVVSLVAGCSQARKEPDAAQDKEKPSESESRVQHGTNGEVIVSIDAATAKTMGLKMAPLERVQLPPETKAYGHVLDPAPLASLVGDLLSATATAAASDAELKRVQGLAAQSNASQKALQAAQAAAVRDNAQVQSLHLRILASWGEGIVSRQELPEFVQRLSALKSALIQLNLPAGAALPAAPTGARLITLSDASKPIAAQFLGRAPATDPQLQSRGFFFLVETNSTRLGPGEAVSGLVEHAGEPVAGVAVPRSAVVRFNGETWVYLQIGEGKFQRVQIQPGPPLDDALLIQEGLRAGDRLVTVGAQELLSEELKGQGGD